MKIWAFPHILRLVSCYTLGLRCLFQVKNQQEAIHQENKSTSSAGSFGIVVTQRFCFTITFTCDCLTPAGLHADHKGTSSVGEELCQKCRLSCVLFQTCKRMIPNCSVLFRLSEENSKTQQVSLFSSNSLRT